MIFSGLHLVTEKNAVDYMNEYKKNNQGDKAELVITGGNKNNVSR